MLFWIFFVRCSSRNIIFLIVSGKEMQKYDQRKFYFFSEMKHFEICYSRSSLKKKIAKKIYNFSFRTPKLQKKNRNKQNFE